MGEPAMRPPLLLDMTRDDVLGMPIQHTQQRFPVIREVVSQQQSCCAYLPGEIIRTWVLRLRQAFSGSVPQYGGGFLQAGIIQTLGSTGKSKSDTGFTHQSCIVNFFRYYQRIVT